ncbi:phage integrase family protein [Neorickettsia helminthoeca str. Oregon]|uniref:Phage integrase family protein n=1 Tax=Neorickettsia helminthoeca str. Oregon TaxID=1286528 RepID=X5HLR1_9RICK|nr:tyrosine-type recombinase/integrase [Neorickettsia helminthoeca]AHX11365.1 phage integrase family protein [Neorickettsia helminthoeca str. Oregon]
MESSLDSALLALVYGWINWLSGIKNFSSNTVAAYKIDLLSLLDFLCRFHGRPVLVADLTIINNTTLRGWFADRRRRKISFRANSRALSSVKNFFRYLGKHQGIVNEEVLSMALKFRGNSIPKSLTLDEITEVIEKFSSLKSTWIVQRNIALCYLLYGSGLRVSEALNLRIKDLEQSSIKVLGKGNKERMIQILPVVRKALEDYLELCPFPSERENFLFLDRYGNKLCRTVIASAMISLRKKFNLSPNITPHALRHSFATHLLQSGIGIRKIQELLGHSSLASTEVYTKLDVASLVKKYAQFSPLDDD